MQIVSLFSLPWGLYAGIEGILVFLLVLTLRGNFLYRRFHLIPDVIRETMDLLPEVIP